MTTIRHWTEEDNEYLRTHYPTSRTSVIASYLGRSAVAVKCRAAELGVRKTREAIVETAAVRYDALIESINTLTVDEVPLTQAFKHKEWLNHKYNTELLSTQDIAEITSCTRKNVEYWMRKFGIERRDNITSRTPRYRNKISATGKGRVPFSKGLTKYDHPSLMLISEKMSGEKSPHWKGGTYVDVSGYRKVRVVDHPKGDKDRYVLEHRLVAEFHLARLLTSEEVVHHRDHNRLNNFWENLYVFPSNSSHLTFHAHKRFRDPLITEEKFMEEVYLNAA